MDRNRPVECGAGVALDRDCGNLDGVATTEELLRKVADVTLLAPCDRRVELREQENAHGQETLSLAICSPGGPERVP